MALLGFELVYRFLWGWVAVVLLVDRRETSEKFLKISFRFAAGFAAFLAWIASTLGPHQGDKFLSLAVLLISAFVYDHLPARWTRLFGAFGILVAPYFLLRDRGAADILNFFTSAAFMGCVFNGQFLGHWYLNVPGLPIRELKRIVWASIITLGIKCLELAYTLFIRVGMEPRLFRTDEMGRPMGITLGGSASLEQFGAGDSLFGLTGDHAFGLGSYGLLILLSRVLWGLLAPALLLGMIKKTTDIRATQSATGIYYALCVMILVGEGAALYLYRNLGWPL